MKASSLGAGVLTFLCLVGFMAAPVAAGAAGPGDPHRHDRWIALFRGDLEPRLHAALVPIWDREEGVVRVAVDRQKRVQLSWPRVRGVTDYVVERAEGGCDGTFAGIASTPAGSLTDTTALAGATYGYRVRTCPFQVSNCVAQAIPGLTRLFLPASPAR